jgi:hypothetical protein
VGKNTCPVPVSSGRVRVPPTGKKLCPYSYPSGRVPDGYRVPVPKLPSLLPHNIDLMRQERNIVKNIISMCLDVTGFSKDNMNVRKDLPALCDRPLLEVKINAKGNLTWPWDPYWLYVQGQQGSKGCVFLMWLIWSNPQHQSGWFRYGWDQGWSTLFKHQYFTCTSSATSVLSKLSSQKHEIMVGGI